LKHEYLLPFDDETFEVILSFGVLEHVPNDKQSLMEINRILKPNGLFFCFYLPYKYSWRSKIIYMKGSRYHDHFYDRNIVENLIKETGFHLVDLWYRDMLPLKSQFYNFRKIENVDNWFCRNTLLKYLASNIEFVANKNS
jgi:SAM-dependent methyltransferase